MLIETHIIDYYINKYNIAINYTCEATFFTEGERILPIIKQEKIILKYKNYPPISFTIDAFNNVACISKLKDPIRERMNKAWELGTQTEQKTTGGCGLFGKSKDSEQQDNKAPVEADFPKICG